MPPCAPSSHYVTPVNFVTPLSATKWRLLKNWDMSKTINRFINYLEMIVAALLFVAVVIMIIECLGYLITSISVGGNFNFDNFLSKLLNLIIGLEFARMLCKHTPGTILEVVLFATARQLMVSHTSAYATFLGVVSICIIFIIRKYLLPDKEQDHQMGLGG